MEHRQLSEIYPAWRRPMDADDVKRICSRRLGHDLFSIDDITDWIERRYPNPYDREALAGGVADFIADHSDPDEEDYMRLLPEERDNVQCRLRRIIRHAQSDQAVEEDNFCDPQTNPTLRNTLPDDYEDRLAHCEENHRRLQANFIQSEERSQEQFALLNERIDRLSAAVDTKPAKADATLSEALCTPEAQALLRKAQLAGFLDEDMQPICSRPTAALLANEIADRLGLQNKWAIFEQYWKLQRLAKAYQRALESIKGGTTIERIKAALQ